MNKTNVHGRGGWAAFVILGLVLWPILAGAEDKHDEKSKPFQPKLVWERDFNEVERIIGFSMSNKGDVVVSENLPFGSSITTRVHFIDRQARERWHFETTDKSFGRVSPNGKFFTVAVMHDPNASGEVFHLTRDKEMLGKGSHYFEDILPTNKGDLLYGLDNSEEYLDSIVLRSRDGAWLGKEKGLVRLTEPPLGYEPSFTENFDSLTLPDENSVKLFKKDGTLVWQRALDGTVTRTSLAGNGQRVAALVAVGENNIAVLDKRGNVLWKKTVSDIGDVKLTHDGEKLLLVGRSRLLLMKSKTGNLIWERDLFPGLEALDYPSFGLSKNGKVIAVALGISPSKVFLLGGKNGSTIWETGFQDKDVNPALSSNARHLLLQVGNKLIFYRLDFDDDLEEDDEDADGEDDD